MAGLDDHLMELSGPGFELRSATSDDQDLARRVISMATHWRHDDDVPHELSPAVAKYYENWGRPDDIGVFAFRGIEFAGGAFVRRFGAADGAYGYVGDEFPELSIGIEPSYRRRGLGVLLLAALKAKVIEAGHPGISLSVEPDNGARHLYSKLGFKLVENRGDDLVMLWQLGSASSDH